MPRTDTTTIRVQRLHIVRGDIVATIGSAFRSELGAGLVLDHAEIQEDGTVVLEFRLPKEVCSR